MEALWRRIVPSPSEQEVEPAATGTAAIDYAKGLAALAALNALDTRNAEYGRFISDSDYRGYRGPFPDILGPGRFGWLQRGAPHSLFWFEGVSPTPVRVTAKEEKRREFEPIAMLQGRFEPADLRKDAALLLKSFRKGREEFSGNEEEQKVLLSLAALCQKMGEGELASRLAQASLGHLSENEAGLAVAGTVNWMAEKEYTGILSQLREEKDLTLFADRLRGLLKKYEGGFFWYGAVELLLAKLESSFKGAHSEDPLADRLAAHRYTSKDLRLMGEVEQTFWFWNSLTLAAEGEENSPVTELVKRGMDALPSLIRLAKDERFTTFVVAQEWYFGHAEVSGLGDVSVAASRAQAETAWEQLPKPITLAQIAQILASPIQPNRSGNDGDVTLDSNRDELVLNLTKFHSRYGMLKDAALAMAIAKSDDPALKGMVALRASDFPVEIAQPVFLALVQSQRSEFSLLPILHRYARQYKEKAAPVIDAYLKSNPAESIAGAHEWETMRIPHLVASLRIWTQARNAHEIVSELSKNTVSDAAELIGHAIALDGAGKTADSIAGLLHATKDPETIGRLLDLLQRIRFELNEPIARSQLAEEEEPDKSVYAELEKLCTDLRARKALWEGLFELRAEDGSDWMEAPGTKALMTVYSLVHDGGQSDFYSRSGMLLASGPKLVPWLQEKLGEYWSSAAPLPAIPEPGAAGAALAEPLMTEILSTEAAALRPLLDRLNFEQSVAVCGAAKSNARLMNHIAPVVNKMRRVRVSAADSSLGVELRKLEGQAVTEELVRSIIEKMADPEEVQSVRMEFLRTNSLDGVTLKISAVPPPTESWLSIAGADESGKRISESLMVHEGDFSRNWENGGVEFRRMLGRCFGKNQEQCGFVDLQIGENAERDRNEYY